MKKASSLKNLKRSIIVSGAMALVIFALLISISYARFTETRTVYSSFSAASFNAVLLGDVTLDELQEKTLSIFGDDVANNEYTPGMSYNEDDELNSARIYPFSVSNGMTDGNVSEIGIQYSVRIRTTHNLPLVFTLGQKVMKKDAVTGAETYRWVYYTAVQSGTVAAEKEGDPIRYEYRFYSNSEIQEHLADENHEMAEATFGIVGEVLSVNTHKLILEWPIFDAAGNLIEKTIGTDASGNPIVVKANDAYWMKEVEHMEVLLACTSANELKDADGEDVKMPNPITHSALYEIPIEEHYGTGIVILSEDGASDPEKQYEYHYKIDYRAFYNSRSDPGSNGGEFTFRITNGTALQHRQKEKYIYYRLKLMVPYNDYRDRTENWYDQEPFQFSLNAYNDGSLFRDGMCAGMYIDLLADDDLTEYRLYDELTGTYRVVSGPDDPRIPTVFEDEMRRYQLYVVYSYANLRLSDNNLRWSASDEQAVFRLSNTLTKDHETVYTNDSFQMFQIIALATNEQLKEAAFQNKLTLIVECNYSNDENKTFTFDPLQSIGNAENGGAAEE